MKEENSMPLPKYDAYTTDYIYSLPEGKRAELIDGIVYDMAPQTISVGIYGDLQINIAQLLK